MTITDNDTMNIQQGVLMGPHDFGGRVYNYWIVILISSLEVLSNMPGECHHIPAVSSHHPPHLLMVRLNRNVAS